MQLVMLAPASNLVTSVTAALMPTLLGPAANMATKPLGESTSNKSATRKQGFTFIFLNSIIIYKILPFTLIFVYLFIFVGTAGLAGERKESDDVSPSSSSSKLSNLAFAISFIRVDSIKKFVILLRKSILKIFKL